MTGDPVAGEVLTSERFAYLDDETGAEVIQWTQAPCKNHHLYFTSQSVTADNRWLVFLSDRDGHPNVYAISRDEGTMRRLSRNREGLLRSYVYPRGGIRGLSKASPCLDPLRNRLFYIRDDQVFRVDLDDLHPKEKRLCALPSRWWGAYTHISPDGKTFCVPCTDPRAFGDETTQWEQLTQVPTRMKAEGLQTRLHFINTESGHTEIAAEMPFWVTHVQFDPAGTGRLLFNLEGHLRGIPLPDRVWCLEPGGSYRPLAPERDGEWRSHENWAPDGNSIVYHGKRNGRAFVAARHWDGKLLHEIPLDGVECHHATGLPGGRGMVVDRLDGMISLLNPGIADPKKRQEDLCRHDTDYADQDAHGHPLATPDGGSVVFTSSRSGHCQVYEVSVPESWRSADHQRPRMSSVPGGDHGCLCLDQGRFPYGPSESV